MKGLRNFILASAVFLAITAAFIYFVDLETVIQQLQSADWRYLLLAFLALLGGLYTYGLRWWALMECKPGQLFTFHAANIGHVVNIFVPLRLGEAARIVVMGRHEKVTVTEATSSFILERLFEQVMRLAALVGAIILGTSNTFTGEALMGGLLFLAVTIIAIFWLTHRREYVLHSWPQVLARLPGMSESKGRQILTEWLDNLTAVASPQLLLLVLFWSIINWAFFWGYHYFSLQALHLDLTLRQVHIATLVSLASAPPSAPTQPIIYHASVVGPLYLAGFEEEPMTSYAVIMHTLQIVWMLPLGAWALGQTGFSARSLLKSSKQVKETVS